MEVLRLLEQLPMTERYCFISKVVKAFAKLYIILHLLQHKASIAEDLIIRIQLDHLNFPVDFELILGCF